MLLTIVSFLIIFTVICVAHEFGHFLFARINGIQVNEFMIGMGPCLFRKKFKTFTFTIRLLPIGGACLLKGQFDDEIEEAEGDDKDDEDEAESEPPVNEDGDITDSNESVVDDGSDEAVIEEGIAFNEASVGARIATVFAGPLFSFLAGFLLAIFVCWFCGSDMPVVDSVEEGKAAEAAGIQGGDKIISINGEKVYLWRDISIISLLNEGEPMEIVYERDGHRYTTTLTPTYDEEQGRYYIGFVGMRKYAECNNIHIFKYAAYECRYCLVATVKSIKYLIQGKGSLDDLSGPVGCAVVINDTIKATAPTGAFNVFLNMVNFALILTVNLSVVNLLPLPALDGGRLVFLLWEAITRKPVPPEKEGIIHLIGTILLLGLAVCVFFNDIGKIFK